MKYTTIRSPNRIRDDESCYIPYPDDEETDDEETLKEQENLNEQETLQKHQWTRCDNPIDYISQEMFDGSEPIVYIHFPTTNRIHCFNRDNLLQYLTYPNFEFNEWEFSLFGEGQPNTDIVFYVLPDTTTFVDNASRELIGVSERTFFNAMLLQERVPVARGGKYVGERDIYTLYPE